MQGRDRNVHRAEAVAVTFVVAASFVLALTAALTPAAQSRSKPPAVPRVQPAVLSSSSSDGVALAASQAPESALQIIGEERAAEEARVAAELAERAAAAEAERLAEADRVARARAAMANPVVPAGAPSRGPHSDAWWHGVSICEQSGNNHPFFGYFSIMDGSAGGLDWATQVGMANGIISRYGDGAWAASCVAAGYAASPGG